MTQDAWINVGFDWTRRVKCFHVDLYFLRLNLGCEFESPQAIWGWCRERIEGMPEDIAPRGISIRLDRHSVLVSVQSASFPVVAWSEMAPEVLIECQRLDDGDIRMRWPA